MEVVEHLLLQLLDQAGVWSVTEGESGVQAPDSPLALYLAPAVPHAGYGQAHHQHRSSQQAQDDSVGTFI